MTNIREEDSEERSSQQSSPGTNSFQSSNTSSQSSQSEEVPSPQVTQDGAETQLMIENPEDVGEGNQ
jgi:hypothetical protein